MPYHADEAPLLPEPVDGAAGTGRLWCRTLGMLGLFTGPGAAEPVLDAGKPLALLAYLALVPNHRSARDHVAELLWPDAPLADARHSLRQALYRLRQVSPNGDPVTALDSDVVLGSAVRFDCIEAEARVAAGELDRAEALLSGAFLEGFAIPESREFESWVEAEGARFRALKVQVLAALAERHLSQGDGARGLVCAETLAALQPFDDRAARLVMSALALVGRHATAVARFHAYAELLRLELDRSPGATLRAYADELAGYATSRAGPAALPLVAREREWATLEAAWRGAEQGRGGVVLLEGAAGLGKTRLVDELARRLRGGPAALLSARCSEIGRALPYGVVGDLLAGLVERPELAGLSPAWLAEAARLLPELHDRFPNLSTQPEAVGSPAAKRRLHQALVRCVEVVAEERPVAMLVDDLHWADGSSLEVLHLMAQRTGTTKTLLVTSFRPAELTPVARQFVRAAVGGNARLLTLEPLDVSAVQDLLHGLATFDDPALGRNVAELLTRQSAGNPLLLGELLDAIARSRLLWVSDGRWQTSQVATGLSDLPRTLGKLMADRVDRLEPWMRTCVETLAIAGHEVGIKVLAQALNLSEPRLELALVVLAEERLVKQGTGGDSELIHDELRRIVYQGIPDDRRRLLHLAVGLALEAAGEAKRPGGAGRLAHHFDLAGEREQTHRYALLAAGEARALAAPEASRAHLELAEAHAPRALPPGKGVSRTEGRRRSTRNLLAILAAVVVLALGAFVGMRLVGGPVSAGYAQGRLYLAADPTVLGATHVIEWPTWYRHDARIAKLTAYPTDLPPEVISRDVDYGQEHHAKIFLPSGTDTVQLTDGNSDDLAVTWLPDQRELVAIRGWKDSSAWYRSNVFLINPRTRGLRAVTTTQYQDGHLSWSPTGTSFVVRRDSAEQTTLWLYDADGSHPEDLTRRFGLPSQPALATFSPDGKRIALVLAGPVAGGAMRVLDLGSGEESNLGGPAQFVPPRWSPDGKWLVYLSASGGQSAVTVVPVANDRPPVKLVDLPPGLHLTEWGSPQLGFVDRVKVDGGARISVGQGVRLAATAIGGSGRVLNFSLRWSAVDRSVAWVDSLGFVRGRRQGITAIVASAGGFRADTVSVSVIPSTPDTLFSEAWTDGLDTSRWRRFGDPLPMVIREESAGGRPAFFSNGDFNNASGAATRATFLVDARGLTLLARAWLPFTGGYYQHWQFGGLPDSVDLTDHVAPQPAIGIEGPRPAAGLRVQCWSGLPMPDVAGLTRGWHEIAIEIRPDGVFECWVDGRLIEAGNVPALARNTPLAVLLQGRSVGTHLLHGRVVVTRGLKY